MNILTEEFAMRGHKVDMYLVNTKELEDEKVFKECLDRMPRERQEKTLRYKFQKDRRLSLAAGLLLEKGLSDRGVDYKTADIGVTEAGKPYLKGREDLYFSVAHSGEEAIATFSDVPTGCDIELVNMDRDITALAGRFFSSDEAKEVEEDPESFFTYWTLKESYLKALGTGLSTPLSEAVFDKDGDFFRHGEYYLMANRRPGYSEAVCIEDK